VLITNLNASGLTFTAGGGGNGGGNMTSFTGTINIADTNNGVASAGSFRFNNGGANNNVGNAAMTLNLGGPLSAVHFTEKNSGVTTHFGALIGGPNTQLASNEKYVLGEANQNTTFAGTITGAGSSLTKSGTGTFIMTGNNVNPSGAGTMTVNKGVLQIGDGVTTGAGALGPSAISVVSPGTLNYNKPDAFSVPNAISGSGALLVNAPLGMTYNGTNSSSGNTTVASGTLLLGATGYQNAPVLLDAGTTFDVTANTAFTLASSLSGFGNVNGLLTAAAASVISPGNQMAASGTLTLNTGLTEPGAVNNDFVLSTPTGTNDLLAVTGNLTLSGMNNIILSAFGGGTIPNGTYPLITYTGTLSGGTTNFAVTAVGVTGTLTNITTTTPPEIAVIISPASRGPTNLTWIGDGGLNLWDMSTSNWVHGVTSFSFQAGDSVLFNDAGTPNTNVNLTVAALPAAVTFSNSVHYTLSGIGSIDGATGLTKTNTGTLTMLTTNTYTGPTIVGQGTLEIQNIGLSGTASGIGAANSNPTNLVLNGSTFLYSGPSANTDHGLTLNGSVGIFDVIAGVTLTLNGTITGGGALALTDSGKLTLASVNTYSGGTVISNGVLALGSNNANNNGSGGSGLGATNETVTFDGGTLQLFGGQPGASQGANYNTLYNPLVVPAGQSGTLIMFPRGPVNTGNGAGLFSSLTGAGTLNLQVNYVRDALSGNWSAFTGLIVVTNFNASGDEMRINNNFGYSNAAIYLNGTFTMDSTLTANAIINIGELGGVSTAILGPGNATAPGPTWCVGWKNTTNTFAGVIEDDNTSPGGHTSIIKVGTGAWYLSGPNTFTGSTTVSNGVLGLTYNGSANGAIGSSTNIFINAGAVLDVSGRNDDMMPLATGQVICGNGTINGILDTTGGGTATAGGGINGAIGTLTATNDINLGGTAWMKLNRGSTPNSDRLVSSQSFINYGGTLVATNTGARLQTGDTFTLFHSAGSVYNSSFTSVVLPNYYTWDTSQLAVSGSITVTGTLPPPALTNVDFSALASGTITLHAVNGAINGPVTVLTSTNLAAPISTWTVVTSTTFDPSGNLSLAITVDPALPQSFYILQAY
jgi:fibronectin-binding autotransporter adhesin